MGMMLSFVKDYRLRFYCHLAASYLPYHHIPSLLCMLWSFHHCVFPLPSIHPLPLPSIHPLPSPPLLIPSAPDENMERTALLSLKILEVALEKQDAALEAVRSAEGGVRMESLEPLDRLLVCLDGTPEYLIKVMRSVCVSTVL